MSNKIEFYKDTDIWKYLISNDIEEKKEIYNKLAEKYSNTAISCNPIQYEIELLAKRICSSPGYTDARFFFENLSEGIMVNRFVVRKRKKI